MIPRGPYQRQRAARLCQSGSARTVRGLDFVGVWYPIQGEPKASLKACLGKIKEKFDLHPALESAFVKLYGWTSDADGIRHALTEDGRSDFQEAKFMFVARSAFVSYLVGRCAKTGIEVK